MHSSNCRFCNLPLKDSFCDLGSSPLSNQYLTQEELAHKQLIFPLHAYVCANCLLVQLPSLHTSQEIFSEYAYFSSYSSSWLEHSKTFARLACKRFHLNTQSKVVEIASNDGYLLQFFKEAGIPILGIEPAKNIAEVAINKGIPTLAAFFDLNVAQQLKQEANLLIGNNVLAHVPNLNEFIAAMKITLKPTGVISMEFPHLLKLIEENQFDTIYHEHFSYFSFRTVNQIFSFHGLTIFDVDTLSTHGGSLRIYAKHQEDNSKPIAASVYALIRQEQNRGLDQLHTYQDFKKHVEKVKKSLLDFLDSVQKHKQKLAAYGAPAKGNTLLNYCGLSPKSIPFTVDKNPYKQGKFLPGTRIPILHPEHIRSFQPDYLLVLPWNLKHEIMKETQYIQRWGGKFVIPIPELEIVYT